MLSCSHEVLWFLNLEQGPPGACGTADRGSVYASKGKQTCLCGDQ